MTTYKIIRFYEKHPRSKALYTGLTLEEAQAHCNDPETSSRTCTTSEGKRRTRDKGAWFDGYEQD